MSSYESGNNAASPANPSTLATVAQPQGPVGQSVRPVSVSSSSSSSASSSSAALAAIEIATQLTSKAPANIITTQNAESSRATPPHVPNIDGQQGTVADQHGTASSSAGNILRRAPPNGICNRFLLQKDFGLIEARELHLAIRNHGGEIVTHLAKAHYILVNTKQPVECRRLIRDANALSDPLPVVTPHFLFDSIKNATMADPKDDRYDPIRILENPSTISPAPVSTYSLNGRNPFTSKDREFIVSYFAQRTEPWSANKAATELAELRPSHTKLSYQTFLQKNMTSRWNIKNQVKKFRETNQFTGVSEISNQDRLPQQLEPPTIDTPQQSTTAEIIHNSYLDRRGSPPIVISDNVDEESEPQGGWPVQPQSHVNAQTDNTKSGPETHLEPPLDVVMQLNHPSQEEEEIEIRQPQPAARQLPSVNRLPVKQGQPLQPSSPSLAPNRGSETSPEEESEPEDGWLYDASILSEIQKAGQKDDGSTITNMDKQVTRGADQVVEEDQKPSEVDQLEAEMPGSGQGMPDQTNLVTPGMSAPKSRQDPSQKDKDWLESTEGQSYLNSQQCQSPPTQKRRKYNRGEKTLLVRRLLELFLQDPGPEHDVVQACRNPPPSFWDSLERKKPRHSAASWKSHYFKNRKTYTDLVKLRLRPEDETSDEAEDSEEDSDSVSESSHLPQADDSRREENGAKVAASDEDDQQRSGGVILKNESNDELNSHGKSDEEDLSVESRRPPPNPPSPSHRIALGETAKKTHKRHPSPSSSVVSASPKASQPREAPSLEMGQAADVPSESSPSKQKEVQPPFQLADDRIAHDTEMRQPLSPSPDIQPTIDHMTPNFDMRKEHHDAKAAARAHCDQVGLGLNDSLHSPTLALTSASPAKNGMEARTLFQEETAVDQMLPADKASTMSASVPVTSRSLTPQTPLLQSEDQLFLSNDFATSFHAGNGQLVDGDIVSDRLMPPSESASRRDPEVHMHQDVSKANLMPQRIQSNPPLDHLHADPNLNFISSSERGRRPPSSLTRGRTAMTLSSEEGHRSSDLYQNESPPRFAADAGIPVLDRHKDAAFYDFTMDSDEEEKFSKARTTSPRITHTHTDANAAAATMDRRPSAKKERKKRRQTEVEDHATPSRSSKKYRAVWSDTKMKRTADWAQRTSAELETSDVPPIPSPALDQLTDIQFERVTPKHKLVTPKKKVARHSAVSDYRLLQGSSTHSAGGTRKQTSTRSDADADTNVSVLHEAKQKFKQSVERFCSDFGFPSPSKAVPFLQPHGLVVYKARKALDEQIAQIADQYSMRIEQVMDFVRTAEGDLTRAEKYIRLVSSARHPTE